MELEKRIREALKRPTRYLVVRYNAHRIGLDEIEPALDLAEGFGLDLVSACPSPLGPPIAWLVFKRRTP